MARDKTDRAALYLERFLDNSYARENLDNAVSALRDAYRRGLRKGPGAPADRKFRDRLTEAVVAMRETADAVQSGRKRPKGRLAKRTLVVAGAGAVAAVAVIASSEELRTSLLDKAGKSDQAELNGDGRPIPAP